MISRNNECRFCRNILIHKDMWYICKECKKVNLYDDTDMSEVFENVRMMINNIQNHLSDGIDTIHSIEQKKISNIQLTDEELNICNYCHQFIDCKTSLEMMMNDGIDITSKRFGEDVFALIEIEENCNSILSTNENDM